MRYLHISLLLVLSFLTVVSNITAYAKSGDDLSCVNAFADPVLQSKVRNLPNINESQLPSDFKSSLTADSNFQLMRSVFGDGAILNFRLSPDTFKDHLRGEFIQAAFVKKVLQYAFPKASFVQEKKNDKMNYEFMVLDSAERPGGLPVNTYLQSSSWLQQFEIKMSNPGSEHIDREYLRSIFRLPTDAKVISLNNSLYNSPNEIIELVRRLITAQTPPQILIVSSAMFGRVAAIKDADFLKSRSDLAVINLSELPNIILDRSLHYIVLNDTSQMMHVVYGLSDVNVTAGAVNLAEPLNAKTPTIFFGSHSCYMHDYDSETFQLLSRRAILTGGAAEIDSLSELPAAVDSYLRSPPKKIISPFKIKFEGQSPIEILSERLAQKMLLQTKGEEVLNQLLKNPKLFDFYISRHLALIENSISSLNEGNLRKAFQLLALVDNQQLAAVCKSSRHCNSIDQAKARFESKLRELRNTLPISNRTADREQRHWLSEIRRLRII